MICEVCERKTNNDHFCSRKCYYNWLRNGNRRGENAPMFGKKHTQEAKEKMSKTHKGKKLTEEHKLKISNSLQGEKNPAWKHGSA
jgi:hypothetical protein